MSKQNSGHRTATSSSTTTSSSTSICIRQVSVSVLLVVLVLVLVLAYFKVVAAEVESSLIKSISSHTQEVSV